MEHERADRRNPAGRGEVGRPPARFINRELSWLAFNERVLAEADNHRHPLLERLRFLSISASNLDEFYMVRVAGLKGQHLAGIKTLSQDGLTPAQQLEAIHERAGGLDGGPAGDLARRCAASLPRPASPSSSRPISNPATAPGSNSASSADIFPVLTPLAIDPAHPFPFVANRGLGLALQLERISDNVRLQALILIPASVDRFIRLPGDAHPLSAGRADDRAVPRPAVSRLSRSSRRACSACCATARSSSRKRPKTWFACSKPR